MIDNEPTRKLKSNGGRVVKTAVVCVFVITLIVWQQRYFDALDDVDSPHATLWNWPAMILVAIGILALIVRVVRFSSRFRKAPRGDE